MHPLYRKRTYCIYRRNLAQNDFLFNKREYLECKIVNKNDVSLVRQIEDLVEWLDGELFRRLEHGSLCVAVLDGNKVAGFNLVAFNEVFIPLMNMRKKLRSHQTWSEQISVHKRYRNQDVATMLRYHVFFELKKRGVRTLYGGTLLSNEHSLKLAEKVGFRFITNVTYRKFLHMEKRIYKRIGCAGI